MIEQYLMMLAFGGGFMCGYYVAAYKWAKNADDYRRMELFGKLYKVLHDDDPILNPTLEDIRRMEVFAIIQEAQERNSGCLGD